MLTKNGWDDLFLPGEEYATFLTEEENRVRDDSRTRSGSGWPVRAERSPTASSRAIGRRRRPPRARRWGELAMTGLLLVIGIYLIIGAGRITVPGSANTVGPRFFPYLVGAATVVVAVLLGAAHPARRPGSGGGRRGHRPERADVVAGGRHHLGGLPGPRPADQRGRLAAGRDVDVRRGGLGPRRPRASSGRCWPAAITSVVIWLLFVKALGVVLPGGILLELATSWI